IGFSKKFTSACSVSSEPSWLLASDPAILPRWPTSPICSTRLVTVAIAWKSSVLQNWMNSDCTRRNKES
uniref:Uncharacterized protein n=1 Tax=Astatotilapia calliptera TaxID=8154 RepID=A0AAX7TVE1_ASTCA